MASSSLSNVIKSASYNMLLQIFFRLFTFLTNIILLRYISKEALGLVNVRLLLLHTTIQFLSREAIRKACLTSSSNKKTSTDRLARARTVNLIWMGLFAGIVSSVMLSMLWIFVLERPTTEHVTQYKFSVIVVGMSSVAELFVEPIWIFSQKYDFFILKVIMEGVYLLLRSSVSVFLIIKYPQYSLYAFAFAFGMATFFYVTFYYLYMFWFLKNKKSFDFPFDYIQDFFPNFHLTQPFEPYYKTLVISFYKQSLLKQFLTEGEKYVMTLFGILTIGQQGIYDIINNLGSLAARFIFMPIEESYYIYLSKILSRGSHLNDQTEEVSQLAAKSLSMTLKFVSLVGLLILCFGINYSELLLDIYGGKLLSADEGPLLLKTYCFYVFVLAVNGITECYMFASMAQSLVDSYNYRMLIFSAVFLFASLFLTRLIGSVGFIWANVLNMVLRIGQSVSFIHEEFKETPYKPLQSIIPTHSVKVALFISFVITKVSEHFLCCHTSWTFKIMHIGIGGCCFLSTLLTIYFTESDFVSFVEDFATKRKKKTT